MVKFAELVVKITCNNGDVWYRRIVTTDDEETTLRQLFNLFSVTELNVITNLTLLVEPTNTTAPAWFPRGAKEKRYDLLE